MNPRTNRPVGYAFVDLATAHEAQDAIEKLSGKEILERKVSVQVARKPEPAEAKEGAVSGGEGGSGGEGRKRGSTRGRGRGRGRGGRLARGGRPRTEAVRLNHVNLTLFAERNNTNRICHKQNGESEAAVPTNVPGQAIPLTEAATELESAAKDKSRAPRPQKQRGPPEDGIPSKTKVMVANLPYDLNEEKVCSFSTPNEHVSWLTPQSSSSWKFSKITPLHPLRLPFVLSLAS